MTGQSNTSTTQHSQGSGGDWPGLAIVWIEPVEPGRVEDRLHGQTDALFECQLAEPVAVDQIDSRRRLDHLCFLPTRHACGSAQGRWSRRRQPDPVRTGLTLSAHTVHSSRPSQPMYDAYSWNAHR